MIVFVRSGTHADLFEWRAPSYTRYAANALHGIQEFSYDLPAAPGNHTRRHQGHPWWSNNLTSAASKFSAAISRRALGSVGSGFIIVAVLCFKEGNYLSRFLCLG